MNFEIPLFNFHMHALEHGAGKTLQVEPTIQAAINAGLSAICLTDHYPLPSDFVDPTPEKDCTMPAKWYPGYLNEIALLKRKYQDKILLLSGAEFDWLPDYKPWIAQEINSWPFDYIIGSVHFLGKISDAKGERNFCLDYSEDEFKAGLTFYGGIKSLITAYYGQMQAMLESKLFDGIGHIDLVKKYNLNNSFFSENEEWYQALIQSVLQTITQTGMVLEINSAGLSKKCQSAYPSLWILKKARRLGIAITIGTDGHTPGAVAKDLEETIALAKAVGYVNINRFSARQKIEVPI